MSDRPQLNIVWLKRDLRIQDHEPLHAAEQSPLPYLICYLYEPTLIAYPDTSMRHLQFIYYSILEMNRALILFRKKVHLFYGEANEVFSFLIDSFDIQTVFSYQESGTQITWDRDRSITRLLQKYKINWQEFQRDGIIRGIRNRKDWDKHWYKTMNAPIIQNQFSIAKEISLEHPFEIPADFRHKLEQYPTSFQPAGASTAWRYLHSFAEKRGMLYSKQISKPTESRTSCGRVSPYLAWGNLSVRQVYQFIKQHPNFEEHRRPFTNFLTRLLWRCHFVQKFEVECEYENLCINRGYELLEHNNNATIVQAWKDGKTGFPLVDACMRCVVATGWINFRMRAMVVSVLCHHLDQDWREGTYFLARQFLDYEPGIHFPQFQMQAGTTGTNTIRMYNPVKQSKDHDPEGVFIKKWLPELATVPTQFIHEPWKMTLMEQQFCNVLVGKDYPKPLVDVEESGRVARDKIWGHRDHPKVKEEAGRILRLHVRPR